jgi:hypothetical protein
VCGFGHRASSSSGAFNNAGGIVGALSKRAAGISSVFMCGPRKTFDALPLAWKVNDPTELPHPASERR